MKWLRITHAKNIPLREGRGVNLGGTEIAIFNLGGRFAAIENSCPHRGGPLCDSIVAGNTAICPLHGWKICLDTGAVLKPEICVRVQTYSVRVDDGIVMLQLPDEEEAQRKDAA